MQTVLGAIELIERAKTVRRLPENVWKGMFIISTDVDVGDR